MAQLTFRRSVGFLLFSIAVGLAAYFLGDTITLAVNGLRQTLHRSSGTDSHGPFQENTACNYHFVAS
jgi:hypothetical protein